MSIYQDFDQKLTAILHVNNCYLDLKSQTKKYISKHCVIYVSVSSVGQKCCETCERSSEIYLVVDLCKFLAVRVQLLCRRADSVLDVL